jgi:hypothetical protein
MMAEEIETIRVVDKRTGRGPLLMNKSDFEGQKEQYEVYQDPGGVTMNNMPVGVDPLGRNTSGTYSEPTPSDIRFPDKDATEFENNHGAFLARDAASMRKAVGQPDEPGGVVGPDDSLEIENGLPPDTGEKPPPGSGGGPLSMMETEGTKSLVTKGKDGKRQVVLGGLSEADVAHYESLKGDRTKRLAWISQKRASQPKTLPTPEEVEKSRGGSGKSARRQEEQQRRPGGAAPAQPTSPGATPPKP